MPRLLPRSRLSLIFAAFGAGFLLLLFATLFFRSEARKSVLDSVLAGVDQAIFEEFEENATRIHLHDFHRVQVHEGKTVWEVRAQDAHYYAQEKVTHINNSRVTIYRNDRSAVNIVSTSAKLFLNEESIDRAELQGEIKVELNESLTMSADLAIYDTERREIIAPNKVQISGQGFEVSGSQFRFDIEQQVAELREQVYSHFTPGAKVPKINRTGSIF